MIGQPKISFVENEFRLTGQSKIFLSKFTLDTIIISLSLKFYNIALIFNKWKDNFELLDKDKYLTWLEEVIDKRVTAIVEGNHRKSYYKAAKLVVSLGEVMEANGIVDDKEKFIDNYYQKYSRRTAFRSGLKKYSNF